MEKDLVMKVTKEIEKLEKEINEDRIKHGKSPLSEVKDEEVKKKKK